MLRGFFGNLIFAIIARMLCGNHLKLALSFFSIKVEHRAKRPVMCFGKFQNKNPTLLAYDIGSEWRFTLFSSHNRPALYSGTSMPTSAAKTKFTKDLYLTKKTVLSDVYDDVFSHTKLDYIILQTTLSCRVSLHPRQPIKTLISKPRGLFASVFPHLAAAAAHIVFKLSLIRLLIYVLRIRITIFI